MSHSTENPAAPAGPPLAGLRVLDLTEYMAGPYCTAALADMGAEVIKIERPGKGDSIREWGGDPRNPWFRYINRNKRSMTLNYRLSAGRDVLLRLVHEADILVENYRPTVLEKAGLGWDVLHATNPRLIYCSISGYGYDGPYREKGGFDLIAQAMGGIMHVTGEPDGPPTSVGLPICDLTAGIWGAVGILGAVVQRQHTGRGQRVEGSLLETAVALSSWTGSGYLADGKEPRRLGSRHRQSAPYQRFRAADGHVMIGAGNQSIWERLCTALGHPEWNERPAFRTARERVHHRAELEAELEAVLQTRDTAHWVALLDEAGVPCGPVNTYAQVFSDPQVLHREMVARLTDEDGSEVAHLRTPLRLSEGDVSVRRLAPALGADTEAVLQGAGYTTAEIAALRADGVI